MSEREQEAREQIPLVFSGSVPIFDISRDGNATFYVVTAASPMDDMQLQDMNLQEYLAYKAEAGQEPQAVGDLGWPLAPGQVVAVNCSEERLTLDVVVDPLQATQDMWAGLRTDRMNTDVNHLQVRQKDVLYRFEQKRLLDLIRGLRDRDLIQEMSLEEFEGFAKLRRTAMKAGVFYENVLEIWKKMRAGGIFTEEE